MVTLGREIALYVMAGVATAPHYMDHAAAEFVRRYEESGIPVQTQSLMPYGDWSRKLRPQLLEVRRDLKLSRMGRVMSVRGLWTADMIRATYDGKRIVLIGHSAGGIAAIHAASILSQQGIEVDHIVAIGSPKCAIPANILHATLYVHAVDKNGRPADPITRIGTWGGWVRSRFSMPLWRSKLCAPIHIRKVAIIGGHADYFRSKEPYLNDTGCSNLQITTQAIWDWMGKYKECE